MVRDIPVGNGNLLVTFDRDYNIRDIYYPYVGKANHARDSVSRTGIWVDGQFSWLSDPGWDRSMDYSDTLASHVQASHEELQLQLVITDVVDFHRDVFLRRFVVTDTSGRERRLRIFFHYDFRFWEIGRGDSVQYDPSLNVLTAYKDDCYFLLNATFSGRDGVSDWTTGHKDEQGAEGCWADAEDGELEQNGVSFGSVDGMLAVEEPRLPAGGTSVAYAWMTAGRTLQEVRFLDFIVRQQGAQYYITRTMNYWRAWSAKEDAEFQDLPAEIKRVYERCLMILRTHVDNRGGIVAATDSDTSPLVHGLENYAYVWPRDGAYIASALDKAGYAYLAAKFYAFCADVITIGDEPQRPAYQDQLYMLHKYTVDRLVASTWMPQVSREGDRHLPIQEDETALLPHVIWQHYLRYRDIEAIVPLFRPLVKRTANFMVAYREPRTGLPAPSFDLWEEDRGIYAYTTATVWAGLNGAANIAEMFGESTDADRYRTAADEIRSACEEHLYDEEEGRFIKRISLNGGKFERDYTVDASMYGLWYFGMFEPDDPRIQRTMDAVIDRLWCKTEIGGLARYEGDDYYWDPSLGLDRREVPGNPWFICTLWIAQWHIARAKSLGDLAEARKIFEWACDRALPSGVMPEQLCPATGEPRGVSPLTWSQASFVSAVQDYLDKYETLLGAA